MSTAVLQIKEKDRKRDGKGNPDKGVWRSALQFIQLLAELSAAERCTSQHAGLLRRLQLLQDGIICRHVPYFALVCALAQLLRIRTFNPVSALLRLLKSRERR